MEYAVTIKKLCLKIKQDMILSDVNTNFEIGKIHGIIGRNGSGKSMLFKCICGFIVPTEGEIETLGQKIGVYHSDFPSNVGVIIEYPGFIPYYSGFRNLQILAKLGGNNEEGDVLDMLKNVGLENAMKKHVRKYSLGMKQRLAIAQSLIGKPKLLILDEPFNGLDKEGVAYVRDIFIKYRNDGGTILLASHNPDDIRILCDEIYEMDKGILTVLNQKEDNILK